MSAAPPTPALSDKLPNIPLSNALFNCKPADTPIEDGSWTVTDGDKPADDAKKTDSNSSPKQP